MPEDDRHADWFEVYGEIRPMLCGADGTPTAQRDLYEYRWALGYSETCFSDLPHNAHLWQRLWRHDEARERDDECLDLAEQAKYPAAHVSLYFAADCGWRVSEILATVKHLAPVEQERNWRAEAAKDLTAFAPVIGAAGKVAVDAAGLPELGPVAAAVGRLKLTSVPQATGAEWFVRRVDLVRRGQLFHGIEWQLSLGLLKQLGSRVTGGLLVSFAGVQPEPGAPKGALRAGAVLHYDQADGGQKDVRIPPETLELTLEPQEAEPQQLVDGKEQGVSGNRPLVSGEEG